MDYTKAYIAFHGSGIDPRFVQSHVTKPFAEAGNRQAQYYLGLAYYQGNATFEEPSQSYVKAIEWYRKSAEQGFAAAQSSLGAMHLEGLGTPQDYAEAFEWYRVAADQGYGWAELAHMYEEGRVVPQDYVEAHKWYNLANAQRSREPAHTRGRRNQLERDMTPDAVAEAQRRAREWKSKTVGRPDELAAEVAMQKVKDEEWREFGRALGRTVPTQ